MPILEETYQHRGIRLHAPSQQYVAEMISRIRLSVHGARDLEAEERGRIV